MNFSPRFVKLSEVTTLRNGAGIKQENFTDESNGIPLVKVSNFTQNSIDMSDLTMVNFDHAQKWKSHVIQRGNVLIATVGSWPPNWSSVVGKVVRAPQNAEGSIQNQNTCCLIPTEELHEGYLYYKLKDPKFLEWVVNIAQGSANQARVPVKKLGEYQFELPPMEVQKSIADALESLDLKISANSHINQTLEQMAQAIFKSWFVDFDPVKAKMNGEQPEGMDEATASLFPEKLVESEKGLIPEEWKIGQVKELCKLVQNGGTPKRKESEYWTNGTINWFTTSELSDSPLIESKEKISELGLAKSSVKLWPKGTVLIAIYAAPTVGRLGILSQEAGANQACTGLIPKTNEIGHYLFNSLYFARDWLNNISVGAAQQNISKGIVESLEIIIPSDELIESFGRHVETLWQKRLQLQKESQSLANLRDTLLPKLLSGEIELGTSEELVEAI
ncbi:restriction endonuclease subunit S [Vibrio cincinnatiensis]|uniref:restriction endonuclease subunit S n=1 Tax=Vibrio cincinnatiensis TaxID=675 RepID=UPI001EDF2298|nr:restriction endonuclease subunit S [Vibrio cincinnatiensis]MCG3760831.1 restriction endonuclease subunit S [Vibrio cincinnatiensis]MCG3764147.1 restriction endonuclease subunit S [Vibrio cincinnatiensis]